MAMPHVLVLPYPSQGHINPMLQFAKRLASKGPLTTLVTTISILNSSSKQLASSGPVLVAPISDGYDRGGLAEANGHLETYFASLSTVGAKTLEELIVKHSSSSSPFTCMVYDTYVPWAVPVAKKLGLPVVAFSTQSCAASLVYYYVNSGVMELPEEEGECVEVEGLVAMDRTDLPSFVLREGAQSYQTLAWMSLNQFNAPEEGDWVLFNSFGELESEILKCFNSHWRARAIGPTVPSKYVDNRIPGDDDYAMNLMKPERAACLSWLDSKPPNSVVYVSFGSFATLSSSQFAELAWGLKQSDMNFLWVVRASEQTKLPDNWATLSSGKALVVSWSPQLDVLAHEAVGCFMTHCGWNSTLEALSLGVPMVALPQWTDQPTNAKFVEDVWGVGVRVRAEDGGGMAEKVVRREEIERAVRKVMEGEKSVEMRRSAKVWKEKVREALSEGGSSDGSLNEFVEYLNANAKKPRGSS